MEKNNIGRPSFAKIDIVSLSCAYNKALNVELEPSTANYMRNNPKSIAENVNFETNDLQQEFLKIKQNIEET